MIEIIIIKEIILKFNFFKSLSIIIGIKNLYLNLSTNKDSILNLSISVFFQ